MMMKLKLFLSDMLQRFYDSFIWGISKAIRFLVLMYCVSLISHIFVEDSDSLDSVKIVDATLSDWFSYTIAAFVVLMVIWCAVFREYSD